MYPLINLNSIQIPTYSVMAIIGFIFAILLYMHTAKGFNIPTCDVIYASLYGLIGLLIGAKFVFFLTTAPGVIADMDLFLKYPMEALTYMFGGWVFYGGLIGGAIGVIIYCKKFNMDIWRFGDAIAPCIPFFHVFGRMGCYFAGCCYGVEYHGIFAVTFPLTEFTTESANISRFPTQLTEVFFNFFLFIILYFYIKKKPKPGRPLGIYLVTYALMRFTLEFFRGDISRGGFLLLSTSQWISLALLPLGYVFIMKRFKKDKVYMEKI